MPDDRDRSATETRIRKAARVLIAEKGTEALGVNAVARAAKCDKKLIYRYFGGLDGVLAAVGEDLAADLLAALERSPTPPGDYAGFVRGLLGALIAAYRRSPELARIKAAEWQGGAALAALGAARGRVLAEWVALHRPPPPEGIDVAALNAVLIGAVEAAALSAAATGRFSGLDLASDDDWARLAAALDRIATRAF